MTTIEKKASNFKENVQPFLARNKYLLLAIGGAAAGLAIASLLRTEKGKAFVEKVGESANQFANQVKDQVNSEKISNIVQSAFKATTKKVAEEV